MDGLGGRLWCWWLGGNSGRRGIRGLGDGVDFGGGGVLTLQCRGRRDGLSSGGLHDLSNVKNNMARESKPRRQ